MRQYIGARYVPKFVGLFDNTQAYEALDVVDNGLGTSYIAKKPVPAGTVLTDTTYWTVYGSTNGAILDLQNRMTVAENNITADQSDIANMKKGGDIIIIAASYGVTPSAADNCLKNLENLLIDVYDNIYTAAQSGASFSNGQYLSLIQSVTVNDPENVKDIVIVGFANDVGANWADISAAMVTFRAYCRTTYPNSNVRIAPVSSYGQDSGGSRSRYSLYHQMLDAAPTYHMSMMTDLFHILALDYSTYTGADFWHPSSAGAALIANGIYNCLVNGSFKKSIITSQNNSADKTFNSSITPNVLYDGVMTDTDKMEHFILVTFTLSAALTIEASWAVTKLMTCGNFVKGFSGDYVGFMYGVRAISGFITDTTAGTTTPIKLNIVYDSGEYWYMISTETGANLVLDTSHSYRVCARGCLPFDLN